MDCQMTMKRRKLRCTTTTTNEQEEGADRISDLPDALIHHILSFSDVKLAVQTSVLAKRWRFIWTTLSSLDVNLISFPCSAKFIDGFLSHRNHDSQILKLNLFYCDPVYLGVPHKMVSYAISHNVQDLNVEIPYISFNAARLFIFSSTSIKKLALTLILDNLSESDSWDLPSLKTLHLINPFSYHKLTCTFPKSYLICLPSLQTLLLDGYELPKSISLPALTTLYLAKCQLPPTVCNFPALVTLTLDCVEFPKNTSEFFPALVNLQNLTLLFWTSIMVDWVIDCPQLLNLEINDRQRTISRHSSKIMVLSPKIRNFSSVGFFPITFGVSQLENVNVKLRVSTFTTPSLTTPSKKLKKYYCRVTHMFSGLGSARVLSLDLETIEALSAVSNYFIRFPSPFYNLKYMKVPQRFNESSIPTCLKCYLLGGSPKATIVTTPHQNELIPQTLPDFLTAKTLLPENTLATLVAGAGNDLASYSRKAVEFGLWQGHEVNSEFLGLLDCIVKKYPETFVNFTINSKKLCTMKLNMLCTIVKAFMKTSMEEVDRKMLLKYSALFAKLRSSFNVEWLFKRLNYTVEFQSSHALLDKLDILDSCIDDTEEKLHDLKEHRTSTIVIHSDIETMGTSIDVLQALLDKLDKVDSCIINCRKKLQDLLASHWSVRRTISSDVKTMGTSLDVRYIGEHLFSGP